MLPGCTALSCSELLTLWPSLSPPSSLSGLTHLSGAFKIPIEHRQLGWPECMQEELTSTLKAPPWGGQQRGQGRGTGSNHVFPEVGSSAAVPSAQKKLGLEPIRRTLPLCLQLPSLTTPPAPYFPRRPTPFQASASAPKWPQWAPLPYFPGVAPMLRSLRPNPGHLPQEATCGLHTQGISCILSHPKVHLLLCLATGTTQGPERKP